MLKIKPLIDRMLEVLGDGWLDDEYRQQVCDLFIKLLEKFPEQCQYVFDYMKKKNSRPTFYGNICFAISKLDPTLIEKAYDLSLECNSTYAYKIFMANCSKANKLTEPEHGQLGKIGMEEMTEGIREFGKTRKG